MKIIDKIITQRITERNKIILSSSRIIPPASLIMLLSIATIINAFNISSNVSATESYQTSQKVQFEFNPTINVTVSGNLSISNLATGSSSDSNAITVTASSNAVAGYSLSSTIGTSSTNYTDLRISSSDSTNKFSSITANKASLSNFSDSNWGYSYSTCTVSDCSNTPSWISGDITGTTQSGYNGLPIYTSSTPIKLISSTTNGSSSIKFKIGAKASSTQLAGTYTNTINFIGVANPNPTPPPH